MSAAVLVGKLFLLQNELNLMLRNAVFSLPLCFCFGLTILNSNAQPPPQALPPVEELSNSPTLPSIAGILVSAIDGSPIVGTTVVLFPMGNASVRETTSKASGKFVFTDVHPGQYHLIIDSPQFLSPEQFGQFQGQMAAPNRSTKSRCDVRYRSQGI